MGETEELQELLAEDAERPISRTYPANQAAVGECPKPSSSMSSTDSSQWMIDANGTFRPAGATVPQLAPSVYSIEYDQIGIFFQRHPLLTDTLIDLNDSASTRVIRGIQSFWKASTVFAEHGILFKRGVLLWGPPGSGKTVTVTLLVRDLLEQGGIVVIARIPKLTVAGLKELRRIEPDRPLIVILEDIEEMIAEHGEHDLLGLLDGEDQVANVVNIATTNYPERLGARIVNRPSRFDEVIKIGMPSATARRTYLAHALKTRKVAVNLAEWVQQTEGLSIAHLRELVAATQCLGQPYEETLKRLKSMKIQPHADGGNGLGFSN